MIVFISKKLGLCLDPLRPLMPSVFQVSIFKFKNHQEVNNVDGTCHLLQRQDRIKYLGVLIAETVSFKHRALPMSVPESLAIIVSLPN